MRLELYLTDLFSNTATTIEKCNQMENTLKLSKNIIKKKKDALLRPKEEAPNLSVRN